MGGPAEWRNEVLWQQIWQQQALGYHSQHSQKVPRETGSQEMALLGLTTLMGTGARVGRTSPASQPLEAQGPSEAVTGMKHSEECHLLTPPWKFLEVPKFPPGLHLQGLEKPFQRHNGGRAAESRKDLLFPCFGSRGLPPHLTFLLSLPGGTPGTALGHTHLHIVTRRNILSFCGTVLEGLCGIFQLSSFLPKSQTSKTFQGPDFFQPILESSRFVQSGDCRHED